MNEIIFNQQMDNTELSVNPLFKPMKETLNFDERFGPFLPSVSTSIPLAKQELRPCIIAPSGEVKSYIVD